VRLPEAALGAVVAVADQVVGDEYLDEPANRGRARGRSAKALSVASSTARAMASLSCVTAGRCRKDASGRAQCARIARSAAPRSARRSDATRPTFWTIQASADSQSSSRPGRFPL
jgi:hypothetical protein